MAQGREDGAKPLRALPARGAPVEPARGSERAKGYRSVSAESCAAACFFFFLGFSTLMAEASRVFLMRAA